jgi:hypothetical protein
MCRILVGKPERKIKFGRPRHTKNVILTWILEKYGLGIWIEFICLRMGTSSGLL